MSTYKVERMNVMTGEKINLIGGEKVNIIKPRIITEDPPDGESKPKSTSFNDGWFKTKPFDLSKPIHQLTPQSADNFIPRQDPQTSQLPPYGAQRRPPYSTMKYIAPFPEIVPSGAKSLFHCSREPSYQIERWHKSLVTAFGAAAVDIPEVKDKVNWPMLILLNLLYISFTWVTAITRRSHLQRQEEIKKQEEEKKRQENLKVMEEMKKRKRSKQSRLNKQYNKE